MQIYLKGFLHSRDFDEEMFHVTVSMTWKVKG